ncbi:hypothetical protein KIH74_21045 [Kineosporia sp. J2-2]|uniref:DUF998 domain-containing protein n=1 Tax=Kineosporia corallincola TaxID=2835133 RepID=A0ABS5TK12_9ACTN|nr:hypothetical protein [Kineosporia corallincola]MBT0771437.1 hypothetical protein [Kineosporia corallincola]
MDVSTPRTRTTGAAGIVITGAVIAGTTGVITWLARRAARTWLLDQDIHDFGFSSPWLHVAAMAGIGTVAVATAAGLAAGRHRLIALATLTGAVAGPMTLVAAPVSESLVREDGTDTVAAWHLAVGAVLLAVLAAGTWWTAHLRGVRPENDRGTGIPVGALFLIVTAACLAAQSPMTGDPERPQLVVAAGWSLLVAGGLVAGALRAGGAARTALAALAHAGVLLVMALAYLRPGGWPGVAGWEVWGQSPVVLTAVTAGTFAAAPVLGRLTARLTARLRARPVAPPTHPAAPADLAAPADPAVNVHETQGVHETPRVHPVLTLALALALVTAVAVPVTRHVQQTRSREASERVRTLATTLAGPAPMTDLVMHRDCNGTGLVYCGWTTGGTPRELVTTVRDAVIRATGERPRVTCRPGPSGYSCEVQVSDGGHQVFFMLDPETDRVDGRLTTVGTRYVVQTS